MAEGCIGGRGPRNETTVNVAISDFAILIQPSWSYFAFGVLLAFLLWCVHGSLAALLTLPIVYLGRKRVQWSPCDLLCFVLPFCAWLCLTLSGASGKTYINLLTEPLYLTLAIPIAAILRLIAGSSINPVIISISLTSLLVLTALGLYWFIGPLPE